MIREREGRRVIVHRTARGGRLVAPLRPLTNPAYRPYFSDVYARSQLALNLLTTPATSAEAMFAWLSQM